MVYVPAVIVLLLIPEAAAIAFSAVVALMVTGPVYFALLVVGTLPFVV
jgi:hypothetical protein